MLKIRLSRIGKKHAPMYRLIISEQARDPYGRALEILGSYNPNSKELVAKAERINYWISKGAQMSPTVNNLLVAKDIIKGKKVKASKVRPKKKGAKEEKTDSKPKEVNEDSKSEDKQDAVVAEKSAEKTVEVKEEEEKNIPETDQK